MAEPAPAVPPTPRLPTTQHSKPSIPVILHEAALDSPSFRANAVYFSEQFDAIEKWLDGYARTTTKLSHEILGLESAVNEYLSRIIPPANVAAVDHDYTALSLKRISEGSKEWWMSVLSMAKRLDTMSADPIRNFMTGDLRSFREARRSLDQTQKTFDTTIARYVAQSKTKEPSSLREDAFAVHETRKAYLKASMDFCLLAPQLRFTLDKLLVQISSDVWREMKRNRDAIGGFGKWAHEIDRVRGWSKDMASAEPAFRRELQLARQDIGESSLAVSKPSRELDDYSTSTVAFLGSRGPMNVATQDQSAAVSEKQGWLFLRALSGKPARHTWIRRWYYCRDGIFGWLVNGSQGVLQGDEIGVLLCGAKPVVSEERRFCFEVKTKNQTLLLQAETQSQLMEWLEVFEVAKKKAFEASIGRDNASLPGGVDPAFSITPPSLPEFSAKSLDAQLSGDEPTDRTATLPVPGEVGGLVPRANTDAPSSAPKRAATALGREEGESGRDHAARIMQKLDLHRKALSSTSESSPPVGPSGGIASLISASHGLLPGYPPSALGSVPSPRLQTTPAQALLPGPEPRAGTLAPMTLARVPAPTSLSKAAVVYSSDRSYGGRAPLPTAILANYWGSTAWAHEYTPKTKRPEFLADDPFGANSPSIKMTTAEGGDELKTPVSAHKKAISMDTDPIRPLSSAEKPSQEQFPPNYPVELKTNSAQFRLLFPDVPMDEKLLLVFRASWSSATESPDSPQVAGNGRVYVTPDNMYFYGHQLGLVVTFTIVLDIITEVTAAPGKDCDFIFLHLGRGGQSSAYTRITIKTFLEDLDLLHARLNLLVDDLQAEEPMGVSDLIQALIKLEKDEDDDGDKRSPSADSWENVSANTPVDGGTAARKSLSPRNHDAVYKSRISRARGHLTKLQLPTHPVLYEPDDMQKKVAERHFEISAKACFHVLFGDKSFVFPKLYFERRAQHIAQGPWTVNDAGHMQRAFQFKVETFSILGQSRAEEVTDTQSIDVFSDHVTYVVTHVKTPWHLPHATAFKLVTKIVVTHIAKSKCKLAVFTKVAWSKAPALSKTMVERQALYDASRDGEELADVATDQVRKLGPQSRTKRAIQIYGNVGQQTQVVIFTPGEDQTSKKKGHINPRSLASMLFETFWSIAESVASSLMMWAFAAVKELWNIVTAQRIILALLAVSALTNVVFSSRGSSAWWSERRAVQFMSRIGIGPNVMMSKAIYLADLDEAASSSAIQPSWPEDSYCYSTFRSIANSSDIDAPYEDSGPGFVSRSSRTTARRLRRNRQRLGSYRHDLVVAMRMVNSVERQMLQSEWENWLMDENHRCEQVNGLLRAWNSSSSDSSTNGGGSSSSSNQPVMMRGEAAQKILQEKDSKKREALRLWYEDYCGSCHQDQDTLMAHRESLSMA